MSAFEKKALLTVFLRKKRATGSLALENSRNVFYCKPVRVMFCRLTDSAGDGSIVIVGIADWSLQNFMEKKTLREVHSSIRDLYVRALDSQKNNNVNYAVELMLEVIKKVPALEDARVKLREFERMKTKKLGVFGKLKASFGAGAARKKIVATLEENPLQAMALCEIELAKNLNNSAVLELLCDAALKCDAPQIAMEAREIIREYNGDDEKNLKKLLELYRENGEISKTADVLNYLAKRHPDDLDLHVESRTANVRLKTIVEEEKRAEVKKKLEEEKENLTIQLEEGTIHDERQAQILISKYVAELRRVDSLDMRRKLAEAYMVCKEYEKAAEQLEYVAEKLGALDPTLDKLIEKAKVSQMDKQIAEITAHADQYENSAEVLAQLQEQKAKYQMDRAMMRVNKFPNDSQLHVDLGLLYFGREEYDSAYQEFVIAEPSPQRKAISLFYMGRCNLAQKKFEEAIDCFKKALSEMYRVDRRKLETMYYLAEAEQAAGHIDDARGYYNNILQIRPNFMDVAAKIEALG